MKSSFDKNEFNKLNSILFQKKQSATVPKELPIVSSDNKENHQTTNTNLHQQMQTLKREVQTMLDHNHNQTVEKIIRSTTRHYLEKIKNLSVELPQTLDGFKEAAETFLQSLPLRKRPLMNTQRCIKIEVRFGLKLLFKSLRPQILQIYKQFFKRTIKMVNRKDRTNLSVFLEFSKRRNLSKYFTLWKHHQKEQYLENQSSQITESLIETVDISESLLFEQKTIVQLQKMLSKQAFCQILIVQENNFYTYLTAKADDTFRRDRPYEQDIFQTKAQPNQQQEHLQQLIVKHTIPMKDSLTTLCLKKKQIIETNSPNSDPAFGSIDLPVSSPTGPKHPLLFIPIVLEKKVIAIIRYFWYPVRPPKFQLLSSTLQFVRTTLITSLKLSKTISNFKERKNQEEKQINFKLLKLLGTIENQLEPKKIFQELEKIIECERLTVLKYFGEEAQIVYSTQQDEDEKSTVSRIQNDATNRINIVSNGKTIGLAQIINPLFQSTSLPNLLKIVFQRLQYVRIKELQDHNHKIMITRQQVVNKKSKLERIIKVGLSELTSFSLMNAIKLFQLLIPELELVAADLFILINGKYVSGMKYFKGQIGVLAKEIEIRMKQSKMQVDFSDLTTFGFNGFNENTSQKIQLYNAYIGDQNQILLSLGVSKDNKQKQLVESVIRTFSQWLSHLIKITNYETIGALRKLTNGFELSLIQRANSNQENKIYLVKNSQDIINTTIERIERYSLGKSLQISNDFKDQYSQKLYDLFSKGYYYLTNTNRFLPKQTIKAQELKQLQKDETLNYIEALKSLNYNLQNQTYLHLVPLFNQTFILIIQNVKINDSHLYSQSIQKLIEFQKTVNNTEQYQKINVNKNRETAVYSTFSTLNQTISSLYKPITRVLKNEFKNRLVYVVFKVLSKRVKTTFNSIDKFVEVQINKKKLVYQNLFNLNKFTKPINSLISEQKSEAFTILFKRSIIYSRIKKATNMIIKLRQQKLRQFKKHGLFIFKTHSSKSSYNLSIFIQIISKRLSLSFSSIKKCQYQKINADQSLISLLSFPLNFDLLKNIIRKSKQLSSCQLLIQNKQKTYFITVSQSQQLTCIPSQPINCYRIQCTGFNLLWKLRQQQTISLEFKQYLETISKIVFENVKNYQQLIFPTFLQLNLCIQQLSNKYKYRYYRKWKSIILQGNRMKEYNNIEKVYRYDSETKLVVEAKQRKLKQVNELEEQLSSLKQKLTNSENVLLHQNKQIKKIDKYLGVYEMVNSIAEAQKSLNKRNLCWAKWKKEMFSFRKEQNIQRSRQNLRYKAVVQGIREIEKIVRDKNCELKSMVLKQLIVNCVRLAKLEEEQRQEEQQLMDDSPINSKQYQELVIQGDSVEDDKINDFGHMRIPTFSSIGKKSELSHFYTQQQTKIYQTRYCSVQSSRKSQTKANPIKHYTLSKDDEKENSKDQNYFLPIVNVKDRIINNFENSSALNNSIDMRSEFNTGYKLTDKTLKFLKRFGRKMNTTVGEYFEGDINKSAIDFRTGSLDQSKNSFK